ncbi:MAG: hypothetical protein HY553_21095 [Elusimicrobia bacterium]|nr:hypothetical protein [Elusimicrobiota bacterium]
MTRVGAVVAVVGLAAWGAAQTLEESGGGAPPVGEVREQAADLTAPPDPATLKSIQWSQASYSFQGDDLLWLGRMVHGETGGSPGRDDADAMLWALAQRKFAFPGFRKKSWTLATLVQKYSQPVNTAWLRDGPKCKEYAGKTQGLPKEHPCAEHRFAKRERYAGLAWAELHETARRAVVDFASGRSTNPVPGGVGWYAEGVWKKREKNGSNQNDWEKPVSGWEIGNNRFYKSAAKTSDTQAWTGTEVVLK